MKAATGSRRSGSAAPLRPLRTLRGRPARRRSRVAARRAWLGCVPPKRSEVTVMAPATKKPATTKKQAAPGAQPSKAPAPKTPAAKAPAAKGYTARAWGAGSATSKLAPLTIQRRAPGPKDVQIEIQYCGICHSDLHQVRDEWKDA